MRAKVYRMYRDGKLLPWETVRAGYAAMGELELYVRINGREPRWDIYLATLLTPTYNYVIPCLDQARIVEIRTRWLRLEGVEIIPTSHGSKNIKSDNYQQEWRCGIIGAQATPMVKSP